METLEERTLLTAFTVMNTDNTGAGSLRAAIEAANANEGADTITFDAALAGQTFRIATEILIADDLTITGLGADQLTLDGNETNRIFNVDDGDAENAITVAISGLTLMNGFSASGGAIYNLEQLSVVETTLEHNSAFSLGGGIYNEGTLEISESTLTGNTSSYHGGGIYSTDGSLEITGTDFIKNQSVYSGGGIFNQNGDLTISFSSFTENSCAPNYSGSGGAVSNLAGILTVSDSQFIQNSATSGGAISHRINSTFPPVFTEMTITDCMFQGNTAEGQGGALYYSSSLIFYNAYFNAYIEDCHFSENSASSGGALSLNADNVLLTGSTFFKNSASSYGGGITSDCNNLTVQNSLFEKNSVNFWGGAIYSQTSLILQNSTLSGNTALVVGGGIAFANSASSFEIINSTLTGNAAVRIGGGIYSFGSVLGTLTNSIIAGNTAPSTPQVGLWNTRNNSIVQDSVEGLLDPVLRDNGGVTKTHALLPGSAAIDGGDNDALDDTNLSIINRRAITQDQRGTGFERIVGEAIDIGAFEVQHTIAQVELRLVDEKTTTNNNGESATLPDNLTWVDEWSGYWLEIWISTPASTDPGVLSAAMNLSYNTAITTAVSIEYGAGFTLNQTGTIDDLTGMIENLSAETDLADLGDGQSVLFARIRFESTSSDGIDLDLAGQMMIPQSPEFMLYQTEVQLVGGLATEEVHGPAPETLVFANPFDLNDDDKIDFRDLVLFVSVYNSDPRESNSDYAWFADLDQSHNVNFRDLISFVSNYGSSKAGQSTVNSPKGFPDSWNKQLTVEPTLLPQLSARPVEQGEAETMLGSVVESLEPQLTTAENDQLAQVNIEIVDLPEGVLSNTVHDTIYIDVNAAGYGWFVDDTPDDNSGYYATGPYTLVAAPFGSSAALGTIDLRSVILHELGHLLGLDHGPDDVMQATLVPGQRRLLNWESAADAFFSELSSNETELSTF